MRAALHWRHWQKIEAGENNATLSTIIRVAEALNVSAAELLGAPAEAASDAGRDDTEAPGGPAKPSE